MYFFVGVYIFGTPYSRIMRLIMSTKHYLTERDCRVVCKLSELGVSNEIIAKAFSVPGRTIKPDVSGKTSARRPCGGRKRMTLKPTNEH